MTENIRKFHPNKSGFFAGTVICVVGLYFGVSGVIFCMMEGQKTLADEIKMRYKIIDIAMLVTIGLVVVIMALLFLYGVRTLKLSYDFQKIKKYLGDREVVSIKDMAQTLHKSEPAMRKSLDKMIRKNLFLQAHLNVESTLFLVTDEQYRQYLDAVEMWKEQQKEWEKIGFDEEKKIAIEKARPYQIEIHEAAHNEKNEKVRNSLERMEQSVQKLLEAAERNPKNLANMHTFLNYFLPTADKIIKTYRQLPEGGSHLENIGSLQREVPEALEKLADGFEKLTEKLYQQMEIDITSDLDAIGIVMEQQRRMESAV